MKAIIIHKDDFNAMRKENLRKVLDLLNYKKRRISQIT